MTHTVVAAVVAATFALGTARQHRDDPKPRWHCHPAGGSCVAVEPGAVSPFPEGSKRQLKAWTFFAKDARGLVYSAFTDEASCDAARDYVEKPSRCRDLSAGEVLRRIQ